MQKDLINALLQAKKAGLNGIILSNDDPETDYKALIAKNNSILRKCDLIIEEKFNKVHDGSIEIDLILLHIPSGQHYISQSVLPKEKYRNTLEENSPDVFVWRRLIYEMILGIASTNDKIEAELFGPKRKHREIQPLYDKTADYIDLEYYDHTGKKYIKKYDRRKFERLFLGMTSEEEARMTFEIPEYRRFSWSDIKLSLRCKRCFYIAKKLGIKLNDFDNTSFGLEKITEILLKQEFNEYRELQKTHPIMDGSKAIKLLKHKKLDKWRTAWTPEDRYGIGGIQIHNVWENWLVYGGIDDIWLNENKELIIVDYKSTTNGKIYKEYQQQIEFYAWIFKKNNYKVASVGYLLFYRPITNKNIFGWKLEFEPNLIELEIDTSWVQDEINNASECLSKDILPAVGVSALNEKKKCNLCDYFDRLMVEMKNKNF